MRMTRRRAMRERLGIPCVDAIGFSKIGRWGNMATADRYRQFAAECVRVAQVTSSPNDKAMLLQMADTWLKLAEKAAKSDDDKEAS
jgi:hypothetical protein